MSSKTTLLLLTVLLVCVVTLGRSVEGSQPVTVDVLQHVGGQLGPIPAGTPFVIDFWTDPSIVTQCGQASATISTVPMGGTQIWSSSGTMHICPGLDYVYYVPGISTPGTYWAVVNVASGNFDFIGQQSFNIQGQTTVSTDWAVLSVSLNPPSPNVGDQVIFGMQMTALSSAGPFPQSVDTECTIDGISCGSGTLNYPGPVDTPATVTTEAPWIATPGIHTLTWSVSTDNDPNPSNNQMSTTFIVGSAEQTTTQATTQAAQSFDFSISVSPSQQSLTLGGMTNYAVTAYLVSGTAQAVSLTVTGAPAGVTASFNPNSGTPPFTSTITLTSTASVAAGVYMLTIIGSGGGLTHSATVSLEVSGAPDFTITVSPSSQSALQGQTALYTVNISPLNGFNSQVSLSVSGLPPGVSAVFSPASVTPNDASTLTLSLPASAVAGSSPLTVTGTASGLSHSATVQLNIDQAPQSAQDWMSYAEIGLLILSVVVIILGLIGAVTRLRRKPSTQSTGQKAGTVYCRKCGAPNPSSDEFCVKCGGKL